MAGEIGDVLAHQPLESAVEARQRRLDVDDMALLEVARVVAVGGEERPQRRINAALGFLPLRCRVVTAVGT